MEGCIFAYTRRGAVLLAAAQLGALTLAVGVGRSLRLGMQSATALVLGRAAWVFFATGTARAAAATGLAARGVDALASVWDWEPPAELEGPE